MIGNKRELAVVLRCSLPTIDALIARWPDLPIERQGAQGNAWRFDLEAVAAFVESKKAVEREAQAARTTALTQLGLPGLGDPDDHVAGVLSASEQLAAARLRRIQREEAVALGRLVDSREAATVLADLFGRLGRGLRTALRQLGVKHGLAPELVAAIEADFAAQQRQAVAQIADLFGAPAAVARHQAPPELRLVAG